VGQIPAKEELSIPTPANYFSHSHTTPIHTTQWGGEYINVAQNITLKR
jgi:hypothetical protein